MKLEARGSSTHSTAAQKGRSGGTSGVATAAELHGWNTVP